MNNYVQSLSFTLLHRVGMFIYEEKVCCYAPLLYVLQILLSNLKISNNVLTTCYVF